MIGNPQVNPSGIPFPAITRHCLCGTRGPQAIPERQDTRWHFDRGARTWKPEILDLKRALQVRSFSAFQVRRPPLTTRAVILAWIASDIGTEGEYFQLAV